MSIRFTKYHALGNDYLVIDPKTADGFRPDPVAVQKVCDRHFGLGSDGILYGPIFEETADGKKMHLRIFNPDGGEAEKSGNGVRIFSRYLKDAGYVTGPFALQTLGGEVRVEFLEDGSGLIRIDMGEAKFKSDEIPVNGPSREILGERQKFLDREFSISCVSMGNPHCVIPVENATEDLARKYGPVVETDALFPNRTNVQFLEVIDRSNIRIEIWERGAGYTFASGSSSCAAASVAHRLGWVGPHVTVHMPGGKIGIDIHSGRVLMTGPVTRVSTGEMSDEVLR